MCEHVGRLVHSQPWSSWRFQYR